MEWGNFLTETAQSVIGTKAAAVNTAVSAAPVAVAPSGQQYVEGRPVSALVQNGKILGMPKMVVIGGALALLVGGYFLMRK